MRGVPRMHYMSEITKELAWLIAKKHGVLAGFCQPDRNLDVSGKEGYY